MYNLVSTLVPSFFIGFSSFLQIRSTTKKSRTSSKFDQIRSSTAELADLEPLEKSFSLRTIQNVSMTCWLSGERSLPFGLLVLFFVIFFLH